MKLFQLLAMIMTMLAFAVAGCEPVVQGAAAPPSQGKKLEALSKVTAKYEAAKKGFAASKNDKAKKKAYVDATMALADRNMYGDDLAPRVKYPAALKYYREVLKVDPKNKLAKESADMIVAIYKSMGKKVPGEGG